MKPQLYHLLEPKDKVQPGDLFPIARPDRIDFVPAGPDQIGRKAWSAFQLWLRPATQSISWHPAANDLPDACLTVLIHTPDEDSPVHLGYFDGERWLNDCDVPVRVTHWTHLPDPPTPKINTTKKSS